MGLQLRVEGFDRLIVSAKCGSCEFSQVVHSFRILGVCVSVQGRHMSTKGICRKNLRIAFGNPMSSQKSMHASHVQALTPWCHAGPSVSFTLCRVMPLSTSVQDPGWHLTNNHRCRGHPRNREWIIRMATTKYYAYHRQRVVIVVDK